MHPLLIATDDPALAADLRGRLAEAGHPTALCRSWPETLAHLGLPETRLVLVDAALPGASGPLLEAVAQAASAGPTVEVVGGDLPPLPRTEDVVQAAERALAVRLAPEERALLPYWGLGRDPVARLREAARNPTPLHVEGERGTGKEWVARLVHRLAGSAGPFVVGVPGEEVSLRGATPGTLFLERIEEVAAPQVEERVAFAEATGWRVIGSSRRPPGEGGVPWASVRLAPLRERVGDIQPLARHYLDLWSDRLDVPRRRIHHGLWRLIERHAWPGNQRELETFVVQAATSARGAMISVGGLSPSVLARLEPSAPGRFETRAYEQVVEDRLRSLVTHHTPGADGPRLHREIVGATERVLFRLALERTDGNQKAAAALLGVARNTLRSRLDRLEEEP